MQIVFSYRNTHMLAHVHLAKASVWPHTYVYTHAQYTTYSRCCWWSWQRRPKGTCDMTHSCVWYDSHEQQALQSKLAEAVTKDVWHDSVMCVTRLSYVCDTTHAYLWHDSCVWHDSCLRVTWLLNKWQVLHSKVLHSKLADAAKKDDEIRDLQEQVRDLTYAYAHMYNTKRTAGAAFKAGRGGQKRRRDPRLARASSWPHVFSRGAKICGSKRPKWRHQKWFVFSF